MRILHVLDHSIPLHFGYTFRSAAILREQRAFPVRGTPSGTPALWAGSKAAPLIAGIYPCISRIMMQELHG